MERIAGWLAERYPEAGPMEFYRELFPEGELERRGEHVKGEYHGVAVQIVGDNKAKRYSVTDDLDAIGRLVETDDFCIMSPVSYAGLTQEQRMARFLYAVAIDLDGIIVDGDGEPAGLRELVYQMRGIRETPAAAYALPEATYIVASGRGVHLYYMLERPVPMFRNVIEQLARFRRALIKDVWNGRVTTLSGNRQFESVTQGFRMVGTATKDGGRVRAFRFGGKVSMEYLNSHIRDESARVTTFSYRSDLTLEQARERYPEWYEARIVEGRAPGTWTVKRDLYDWWKRRIAEEAREGHRYFCVMVLAIYAMKCGIEREELERDAYALVPVLDALGSEGNPFTVADAAKALEAYDACYQTFPRHSVEELTAIPVPANKRNGRKQDVHLAGARAVQEVNDRYNGTNWRDGNGRKPKRDEIRAFAMEHPDMSNRRIAEELGVSRNTVNKWLRDDWRDEHEEKAMA